MDQRLSDAPSHMGTRGGARLSVAKAVLDSRLIRFQPREVTAHANAEAPEANRTFFSIEVCSRGEAGRTDEVERPHDREWPSAGIGPQQE
jgi:hypothetical protein